MSVPCSATYVPFCPFLSRWSGFQMKEKTNRLHQQTGVLLYHIIFISVYYTHYDTIIFHYDTIMSLFVCKRPDYYFSLFHYLQNYYYFTYDTSIISLIFISINYCYYYTYDTIICIIFTSNYYYYYLFRRLYHTYFCTYILLLLLLL